MLTVQMVTAKAKISSCTVGFVGRNSCSSIDRADLHGSESGSLIRGNIPGGTKCWMILVYTAISARRALLSSSMKILLYL